MSGHTSHIRDHLGGWNHNHAFCNGNSTDRSAKTTAMETTISVNFFGAAVFAGSVDADTTATLVPWLTTVEEVLVRCVFAGVDM